MEEKRAIEPIFESAPVEPVEEKHAIEPIFESAPVEPVEEKAQSNPFLSPPRSNRWRKSGAIEPIFEPASAERLEEKHAIEPIFEPTREEPDFERFGPYAGSLKKLKLMLDATYGDVGSSDSPGDEAAFAEGLLSGTSSGPDPGEVFRPGIPSEGGPTDSPLARASAEWKRRAAEISRELDEHFGIDGNRPDLGRPPPVSDA